MNRPVIDPEIQAFLPRLSDEERTKLRANIASGKYVESLVILFIEEEKIRVLGDGHNRLEACEELGVDYKTREVKVKDRATALQWIIDNQLGRRNLTPEQRSYFIGKEYLLEKKLKGGKENFSKRQNDALEGNTGNSANSGESTDTAERISKKRSVSTRTVERNAEFAEAVDALAETQGEQAKEEILNGISGKSKKAIIEEAKTEKILCNRCQRTGVVKDCPRCKEERNKGNSSTQGNGQGQEKPNSKKKGSKSGSVKFDDKTITDAIGKLSRLCNDRAQKLNLQRSPGWKDIRDKLNALLASWDRWQLEQEQAKK